MSEYQYKSTFDRTSSDVQSSSSVVNLNPQQRSSPSAPAEDKWSATGTLASFVCHVAYLERKLRTDSGSVFFDTDSETFGSKAELGQGATFRVQRAEWRNRSPGGASDDQNRWGKYVALKSVLPKPADDKGDWRDVLLEVRALLHEPLRYHPNIVRMLGLGWGPAGASEAAYPQLVLEFAEMGSMEKLQRDNAALPFSVKQKLCYDVGRGLAILHACGIVHGDLTHANVLVYESRVATQGLPFTAKLSDFGGSVMDIARRDKHALRMTTWPFSPPETNSWLSEDGVKQTDVFSFGTFVWRTMIDCANILAVFGLDGTRRPDDEERVAALKLTDGFLDGARESVRAYAAAASGGFGEREIALALYVLENTLRPDPAMRSLPKSQWALRGVSPEYVPACVEAVQKRNEQDAERERARAPGSHGIDADSLGASLGKMGHDYDPQNNMPGFRPKMSHPEAGEFLFEPLRLKRILDWAQQETIVSDFERAAALQPHEAPTELQPYMAAFYLFQCYLTEFGVRFDAQKICYWLSKAAEPDESGVNYYAQAWLWRICDALDVPCPVPNDTLEMYFKLSIMRGHRTCLVDVQRLIQQSSGAETKSKWSNALEQAHTILNTMTAGLGMPYFARRKLRRPYNIDNNYILDSQIKEELGEDYEHCLKSNRPQIIPDGESATASEETPKRRNFESIFVNHIGHTLLHYAASFGKTRALRHLVAKYDLDINVQDQTAYETPLVCACRGGHLDAAIALLELGASPNITSSGVESPLYWVSSFRDDHMPIIAQRLIDAGAMVDRGGEHAMRPDVRAIWADWEHLLSLAVTPLGRAVVTNSLAAVKVLLAHGADPATNPRRGSSVPGNSAIDLAAILNLPHILEVLVAHLDAASADYHLFDEAEMLAAARSREVVPFDTTTLQSRLVRHGRDYKTAMARTLELLRQRRARVSGDRRAGAPAAPEGAVLCSEVRLGNADIVECLLDIGHSADGSPGHRPIQEAVRANDEAIFLLLVNRGASVFVKCPVEAVGQLSLLQIAASRPKTSRPSLVLAEFLIHAGVAIQPLRESTRSPLAYALLAQDFLLAHLLLRSGADVNATYQVERDGPWITVLAELAQAHTEGNLASINYMLSGCPPPSAPSLAAESFQNVQNFQKLAIAEPPPPACQSVPAFVADTTRALSILHLLALAPAAAVTSTSQLTARVVAALLAHFGTPAHINAVHPVYGTPLCAAVLASNVPVAAALLDLGADTSVPANRELLVPPLNVLEPATPQLLALAILQRRVNEVPSDGRRSTVSLEALQAALAVVELLVHDEDAQLGLARQCLARQIVASRGGAAGDAGGGGVVDLDGLPEMDEVGWTVGEEMSTYQVTATMLKYVR